MTPCVIAVLGPTASGKSQIAQALACELGGEVVSADSMQVYRGMDIGTAKLPASERKVPHHLIDILEPGEAFSAQLFQTLARGTFDDIVSRHKVPVLCGGTGLYVQAALEDMRFPKGEQTHNEARDAYEAFAEAHGAQALWDELHRKDPESALRIHPNNVRRVVRALEMLDQGISYADQVRHMRELPEVVPSLRFSLTRDPALLAKRIDMRVDHMVETGLVQEVEHLLNEGLRDALTAPQAIGYKEVVQYLDGALSLDGAIEQIKIATRRYAKRQRTWLRRDPRLIPLDADKLSADRIVASIIERYRHEHAIAFHE